MAALTDGKWSFDDADHSEPWYGQAGARTWEPAARPLPVRWRGWFSDGTRGVFTLVGALHPGGLFHHPTVATNLRPRLVADDASHDDVLGVGVAGGARVTLFAERQATGRAAFPSALRGALRQAERSEVEHAVGRGWRQTEGQPPLPWHRLEVAARSVDMHRVLGQADGGRVHAVETVVPFDEAGPCRTIVAFGMVAVSGAGRVTVLAASAACGGPSVAQRPVAAIDRDGRTCWVFERHYEDGIEYVLTPPRPLTDLLEQPACDIR